MSKDLLSLWLAPLGQVESSRRVHGEERQIDMLFTPWRRARVSAAYRRSLGLLERVARGQAALEAFRNPCSMADVEGCLLKLFELRAEGRRLARRASSRRGQGPPFALAHLWIVTPTLSRARLDALGARTKPGYPRGVLATAAALHTTVALVTRLPTTPETLWLRLLGRGRAQERAFDELARLPDKHPLRNMTMRRVLRWRKEAEAMPRPSEADRELIKNTERLFVAWERGLLRKGKAEGRAEGEARGRAQAVLSVLRARGLRVSEAQRARIAGCADLAQLERWLRKAVTAETTGALLASPRRPARVRR